MDGRVFFFRWEEVFQVWFQHLGGEGFLNTLLYYLNNFFSFLGEEYFTVLVMGAVYWGYNKQKGLRIGLSLVPSMVTNNLIKNAVKRFRPWLVTDKIRLLRPVDGYSFPSAHSSSSAAVYSTLSHEYKNIKWLKTVQIVIPLLIAVSRVFLGAHWFTDVVCGLALGYAFFFVTEFLFKILKDQKKVFLTFVVIGFLGFFFCKTDDFFSNYGLLLGFFASSVFEEKYVKFENTKDILFIILRTIGGGLSFVVLNLLLKTVFGLMFGEENFLYLISRTIRYTLVSFGCIGIYPMAFKPFEQWLKKNFIKK